MRTMTLYGCFAIILAMCFILVLGSTSLKYRARRNLKITQDLVNKNIATNGLVECVALCTSESAFQCESASWGSGTCLLSEEVTLHATPALEENVEWNTMSRIVYPVFHARGDMGKSTLTFEEAQSKCEELATSIASRQEMLDARAMGFERCVCGWLSDNTIGYVMQAYRGGCGFSSGIIVCNKQLADVYCVV